MHVGRSTIHTLAIPSSTRYLEKVREFVVSHAQEAQLPEDAVEQFRICVDEACTNIIEHAYKGQDDCEVDIAIIVDPDRFTVRIRDEGEPFDQSAYHEPDLLTLTKKRKAGGLGVHIIRSLMDQVEYRKRGKVNEIRMTKFRPNHSTSDDGQRQNGTEK